MFKWLKSLFGGVAEPDQAPAGVAQPTGGEPAPAAGRGEATGTWYHVRSERPDLDQVVLTPGVVDFSDSSRMLMLTAAYLRVYQSFWCSVLVRLDDEDHPALVIKANDSTAALKDHALRIGLSFIRGQSGNLFASFVDSEAPAPERCPFKPLVVFEDIMGLDHEENRDRLQRQLDCQRLHIWLAEGGEATVENEIMRASPIRVHYEATIDLEPACQAKLAELLERHYEQHLAIGPGRWDFQRSFQGFTEHMPVTRSPVLDPTGG